LRKPDGHYCVYSPGLASELTQKSIFHRHALTEEKLKNDWMNPFKKSPDQSGRYVCLRFSAIHDGASFFKIKNSIFSIDKYKQLGGFVQPDDKVAGQPR